jgi:hypothetical protein
MSGLEEIPLEGEHPSVVDVIDREPWGILEVLAPQKPFRYELL